MFGKSLSRKDKTVGVIRSGGNDVCRSAPTSEGSRRPVSAAEQNSVFGTYISLHPTGFIVGVGPITANGTITFDGKGNSSNTATVSINGVIQRVTVVGPYVVNPDCTGTLSQSDGTNYDMVVLPDGSRFSWIETDSGTVVSGESVRFKND